MSGAAMSVRPALASPTAPPLLLLAEGDVASGAAWSGSARAFAAAVRATGRTVTTADVLPRGVESLVAKALTVHPRRQRWVVRHHFGPLGFALRSRRAARACAAHPRGAPVLQIGATFDVPDQVRGARFLYCDANALFAAHGGSPFSVVSGITDRELHALVQRERAIYGAARGIFTMSERLRRSFIDDFGVSPDRVHTVYCGANLPRVPGLAALETERRAARRGPPTLLFVGKAWERKGGPAVLAAFNQLRGEFPDLRLVVAGCDAAIPPTPGVEVVGWVDRDSTGPGSLAALYASADLFCLPTRYDAFGIVFVEAMMHGVPCVGTTDWAMPEIIADGTTGWVVPPDDVRALTDRLREGLRDRDRLHAMGRAARARAERLFTWERVVERVLPVIDGAGAA